MNSGTQHKKARRWNDRCFEFLAPLCLLVLSPCSFPSLSLNLLLALLWLLEDGFVLHEGSTHGLHQIGAHEMRCIVQLHL